MFDPVSLKRTAQHTIRNTVMAKTKYCYCRIWGRLGLLPLISSFFALSLSLPFSLFLFSLRWRGGWIICASAHGRLPFPGIALTHLQPISAVYLGLAVAMIPCQIVVFIMMVNWSTHWSTCKTLSFATSDQ